MPELVLLYCSVCAVTSGDLQEMYLCWSSRSGRNTPTGVENAGVLVPVLCG